MFFIQWKTHRTPWFNTIGEIRDFLEGNSIVALLFTRDSSREEKIEIAREAINKIDGELIER
jgi:hypothetical protein